MSSLTELREKVERASGPDRELDLSIYALLDPAEPSLALHKLNRLPAITASIDAALALVEQKLPGWVWQLSKIDGVPSRAPLPDCEASVWIPSVRTQKLRVERANGQGATPPLAILSALLRALESQEQAGG